ncbi:hypothetical protein EH223_03290 [candidate division KSB1 bacterium]|nr:MAG: hypothetical protein EH223_03290 [candidate division KSB1 bacterium]
MATEAFKRNWLPGLILQLFGVMVVVAYYFIAPFRNVLQIVADMKASGGYIFSAVITAIFAGFIPFIVQIIFEKERPNRMHVWAGVFLMFFWAYRGVEVDLLYRYQAIWFGDELSFTVILKKTLIDQFIYAPFWSIAIVTLGILFKDCRLSWRTFRRQIDRTFITVTYPSIVFSTWIIWVPGVAIIYSLPQLLQVPMMNIIACFYAILVMYLTRHRKELRQQADLDESAIAVDVT